MLRQRNLDKALVSVIIPAFDAAANIRQTLNAVLAQTYQEIEVIVVDDGSSDATSTIVEEYVARDTRFHLIRQSNAGVGAARNTSASVRLGLSPNCWCPLSGAHFASALAREIFALAVDPMPY